VVEEAEVVLEVELRGGEDSGRVKEDHHVESNSKISFGVNFSEKLIPFPLSSVYLLHLDCWIP